jgi:hypothetical protein
MTFETIREVLGVLAFAALSFRTGRSWPAEWAKPDHVWHYRCLLLITSGFTLGLSLAAWDYTDRIHPAAADPISIFYTAMSIAVLVFCWRWPAQPRSFREDIP